MADLLSALPLELLREVASMLPERDLKSLSLVSKSIHDGIESLLWHSVTIAARGRPVWPEFDLPVERVPKVAFRYMREVTFRLAYDDDFDFEDWPPYMLRSSIRESGMDRKESLSRRVLSVLKRLKDRQLTSFSWRMDTGIPTEILGRSGILQRQHSSIRHLGFLPNYPYREPQDDFKIDLSSFGSLVSLDWAQPYPKYMSTLAEALRINASHLRALNLDFICWPTLQERLGLDPRNYDSGIEYFANEILRLKIYEGPSPLFGTICTLSLSMVPLVSKIAHHINFLTLKSFSIRNCPGWRPFVNEITLMRPLMTLRFFEVQDTVLGGDEESESSAALEDFLKMFHGLEDLVISLLCSIFGGDFWQKIAKAHPDIRHLVYGHGLWCSMYNPPLGEDEHLDPRWLNEARTPSDNPWSIIDGSGLPSAVTSLPLEFLGVCIHPQSLFETLDILSSSCYLRILHLRTTNAVWLSESEELLDTDSSRDLTRQIRLRGEDYELRNYFYSFLEAAFGPQGPPLLEIIAFDELDDAEMKKANQEIFYRNRAGNEVIQQLPTNLEQEDLVSQYWHLLVASPDGI